MIAFDFRLLIVGSSLFFQLIAAFVALRIIIKARQLQVGVFILTAIILMAFRRGIVLVRLFSGERISIDMLAETIALTVSVLLVIGVIYIERIIMKLKQAEAERREKDNKIEQLQRAIASSNEAISILDEEGKFVFINNAHSRIYGYPKEEMLGKTWRHLIPSQYLAESEKTLKEILHNPEIGFLQSETFAQRKDGSIFPIDVNATSLRDEYGNYFGDIFITKDITERKKTEDMLQQAEEKYHTMVEYSNDLIWTLDKQGNFTYINKKTEEVGGYMQSDVFGKSFEQMVPSEHLSRIKEIFIETLNGKPHQYEVPVYRKDGSNFILSVNTAPIYTSSGIIGTVSFGRDITDRRKAEEEISVLASLVDAAPASITVHSSDGAFLYANQTTFDLHGYSREEFLGLNLHDLDVPESAQLIAVRMQQLLEIGQTSFEVKHYRKDGSIIPLYVFAKMLEWCGKKVILCVASDITERKQMEEALRSSSDFIENILNTVDEAFIVIDKDYRIVMANSSYGLQVKMTAHEIIGRHCYEISHQSSLPCFDSGEECAVKYCFETGEPHSCVHRHTNKDGGFLYVETKAFPLKDVFGNVTSAIEVINNITEKYLLEEERLKTQKLEAIGLLAGGIAHDFNNLLQGVFGYISMAKLQLDQKEKSLHMLEQAEKALHMSVSLTSQLLTFSKGGKPLKKKIQLRAMIENSVKFALSGSRVDYSLEVDKAIRMVEADEGQISQVIQNIVLNADQAMPLGGKIAITVKNVSAPHKGLPAILAEGQYVEIAVKDSGSGIPEQYIPRLFDPYFTTKERGSGLGLATSYSIIKNHDGLIDVKSELGKGSTFFVYLPAVEAEQEMVVTVPAAVEVVRKGRILLMDDEELIRNIVGIMIGSLGHEVEFAENGEEAIAKYREALTSGRRFDIVILDLTIRDGMGGEDTMSELLALDSEVRAVVSSGYSDSLTMSEYESRGFSACLTKPYEVEALADILNVLLK